MKRIWIIGNGKSLLETNLELLEGEDTFAMNRIELIYPFTNWRPTHYICYDIIEGSDYWRDSVRANSQARLFLSDEWKGEVDRDDVTWIAKCKRHHFYASDNVSKRAESWHLPTLCTAYGTISPMMQLAVIMGYEEIYLLGCDLWKDGLNHFSEKYVEKEDVERRNRDALWAHKVAKRSCPIPIYNATIGGNLEIYPRVDMREVLNGKR